jgi:hypothetical protein
MASKLTASKLLSAAASERADLEAQQEAVIAGWVPTLPTTVRTTLTTAARRGDKAATLCTPLLRTQSATDYWTESFAQDIDRRIGAPLKAQLAAHVGEGIRLDKFHVSWPTWNSETVTRDFRLCIQMTWPEAE